MRMKQISVPLENSKTRASLVTKALEEKGITIEAISIVDAGTTGELRILASDLESTRNILMQNHVAARVDDVVSLEISGKDHSLSNLLTQLVSADIRIKYAYRYATNTGKMMLAVASNNNQKVLDMLGRQGSQN